ncbi:MAG: hypothetical protein LBT89_01340, partial [Planctomycetaceae bacterium]|nr:hypothetical protein [Planctomycetaceae bacterium]
MSVKNSNEPTVTTTTNEPGTPAPSPSTDVFEEWNIQDERVSGSHTVLDGKIIARMPDLGAVPVTAIGVTVKQSAADEEPGAAELFYRAFAVALRGKRSKSTPSESNKNLFRRVSAVGIVVLMIGAGILFLDKNASDKDVLPETAVSEKSNDGVVGDGYPVVVPPYSVHSVAPHSGTAEQQAALQPPSDVPAAGTNAPNHPAKNPWERTGNPVDGVTAAAASAVSAAGVDMYPIPSQDNTAMNNPAVQGANVDNSFAQQNYPPSYQPSYPPNAGQTQIAAYPAPNQQGNYTGATVAAAGYSQTSAAVPNDYNVPEQTPYQPQPNVNYPNPNGNPNYQP